MQKQQPQSTPAQHASRLPGAGLRAAAGPAGAVAAGGAVRQVAPAAPRRGAGCEPHWAPAGSRHLHAGGGTERRETRRGRQARVGADRSERRNASVHC